MNLNALRSKLNAKTLILVFGTILTLVLAVISVMISLRLEEQGTTPIAPTAPESRPSAAEDDVCSLTFTVESDPPVCEALTLTRDGDEVEIAVNTTTGSFPLDEVNVYYTVGRSTTQAFCGIGVGDDAEENWVSLGTIDLTSTTSGTLDWDISDLEVGTYIVVGNVYDTADPAEWCTGNPGGTCNVATAACPNCRAELIIGPVPTPTPSPSVSPSPSISPTPSPSISPTPSPSISPTPSPSISPTPSPTPTPPASCNTTCVSSGDCSNGLTCSNGLCRNPSCTAETNCICPTAPPETPPVVEASPSPSGLASETYRAGGGLQAALLLGAGVVIAVLGFIGLLLL